MTHAATTHRRLYVHGAHGTVGVLGGGVAIRPYCRVDDFSTQDGGLAIPLRVALVADDGERDDLAALEAFARAVRHREGLRCFTVERNRVETVLEERADVDCVVFFRQGMHMARRWSCFSMAAIMEKNVRRGGNGCRKVNVVPVGRHPMIAGMEPFETALDVRRNFTLPSDATILMRAETPESRQPVAWLVSTDEGIRFHTLLGSPEDWGQKGFEEVVRRAIDWVVQ